MSDSTQKLMQELAYASYVHNRQKFPEISPQSWAIVLRNVEEMEERYEREKANGLHTASAAGSK